MCLFNLIQISINNNNHLWRQICCCQHFNSNSRDNNNCNCNTNKFVVNEESKMFFWPDSLEQISKEDFHPVVNFINVLWAAFLLIFLCQKNTSSDLKHRKAVFFVRKYYMKLFYAYSLSFYYFFAINILAKKMLVKSLEKLTPGRGSTGLQARRRLRWREWCGSDLRSCQELQGWQRLGFQSLRVWKRRANQQHLDQVLLTIFENKLARIIVKKRNRENSIEHELICQICL